VPLPSVQTVQTVQNGHSPGRGLDGVDAKPTEGGRSDLLENDRETDLLNGLDGVDGRNPGSYDDVG
jgi:hypothetical protein